MAPSSYIDTRKINANKPGLTAALSVVCHDKKDYFRGNNKATDMISEAELKVKIFRLIDAQPGEALQEVYNWLSTKLQEREAISSLEQGYSDMAADKKREQEAFEWAEGTLNTNEL